MTIDLVPLATATVKLAEPTMVSGSFVVGEVTGVEFEGRLQGSMKGNAAADWLTLSPEGVGAVDVRVTMETHDGAIVYLSYNGRILLDTMTVYTAPLFHTGDERYLWLNRVQAIAKGHFTETGDLVYEIFEVV
jgi:hypothetical protein